MTGLRAKVEAANDAEERSKDDLDQLWEQLELKTEEVQKFRQKEAKIQSQINDTEKEYTENEGKIAHWQAEHDKLRLKEIDDDNDGDEGDDDEASEDSVKEGKGDNQVDQMDVDDGDEGIKAEPDAPTRKKKAPDDPTKPPELSEEELKKFKKRDLMVDIEYLEDKVKRARPNLNVLDEYRKRMDEVFSRHNEVEKVTKERDDKKKQYDDLRKQRLEEFMAGFSAISLKLKEMYQMITMGGNAELELVDSMDPFSEGIIFSVMPPKKSWKNISNLSGGEKTLSSLALVFALHVFKPTPLYFMDEIDAALDFRNVSIVANYIKDRTKNAQFIIISLRNDMFELSQRLIGIYKTANVTQSISIDNHALAARPVAAVPS
ncbi:hypothetical protein E1B28_004997 [Marasmius oreades]|uniref:Structural maintenance of chromosomes protein 4 n=1 Tax=Marasmius oreades TaxID=181124 RepID=A0A9P7UZQ2_9AGAR|nr:uncharacterized protein E1B28_004997 [Marasmius oreades]KAG7097671.1 hypothetical protein E1B28_004997 [Marasmius oreades]